MTFEHILMGTIIFVLASIYGITIWTEKDVERMEKELSAKK